MIDIDLRSRTPIYEQIKEQIMRLIQLGVFRPNEQLPSIRALSRELNLNINTVKHAFMDLEADGVIYSMPGKRQLCKRKCVCQYANQRKRRWRKYALRFLLGSPKAFCRRKSLSW